jgi:hypothetical protein
VVREWPRRGSAYPNHTTAYSTPTAVIHRQVRVVPWVTPAAIHVAPVEDRQTRGRLKTPLRWWWRPRARSANTLQPMLRVT